MLACWMCGLEFEPDPERMRAWAESGRTFDPTDWECGQCEFDRFEAELQLQGATMARW